MILRALLVAIALLSLGSCGGSSAAEPPKDAQAAVALPPRGQRRDFSYETVNGAPLTPASLAGRVSVLGFIATYDLASQAQVRFLIGLLRDHKPRINVALLVLEPPDNRPLVEAFASGLNLPFPVALADAATIAGEGPFAGLHHVPSVVVLDREGREAFRYAGLLNQDALGAILRAVEAPPNKPGR